MKTQPWGTPFPPILQFFSKKPHQNQCPLIGCTPHLKMKPPIWKTTPPAPILLSSELLHRYFSTEFLTFCAACFTKNYSIYLDNLKSFSDGNDVMTAVRQVLIRFYKFDLYNHWSRSRVFTISKQRLFYSFENLINWGKEICLFVKWIHLWFFHQPLPKIIFNISSHLSIPALGKATRLSDTFRWTYCSRF